MKTSRRSRKRPARVSGNADMIRRRLLIAAIFVGLDCASAVFAQAPSTPSAAPIFVQAGAPGSAPGTREDPLGSLDKAVALAIAQPTEPRPIRLAAGVYSLGVPLPSGVTISGGWGGHDPAVVAHIQAAPDRTMTVQVVPSESSAPARLQDVTILGPRVRSQQRGQADLSSYAIFVASRARLQLGDVTVNAGMAGPGVIGGDGATGKGTCTAGGAGGRAEHREGTREKSGCVGYYMGICAPYTEHFPSCVSNRGNAGNPTPDSNGNGGPGGDPGESFCDGTKRNDAPRWWLPGRRTPPRLGRRNTPTRWQGPVNRGASKSGGRQLSEYNGRLKDRSEGLSSDRTWPVSDGCPPRNCGGPRSTRCSHTTCHDLGGQFLVERPFAERSRFAQAISLRSRWWCSGQVANARSRACARTGAKEGILLPGTWFVRQKLKCFSTGTTGRPCCASILTLRQCETRGPRWCTPIAGIETLILANPT